MGDLLSGITAGLKSGLDAYVDETRHKEKMDLEKQDRDMRREMLSLQKTKMEEDRALDQEKMNLDAAKSGFDRIRDENTRTVKLVKRADFTNNDKELARQLKMLQIAEALDKRKQAELGVRLPSDKVINVNEGGQILRSLPDLGTTIDQNEDQFGPIQGLLGGMNPYNEKSKTIDAQMRMQSQAFGRYMEGGVLRKEDEEKYRKMFPSLRDTPEAARNKLALVQRMLAEKQKSDVGALGGAGYSTAGLQTPQEIPAVPDVIRSNGLLKPQGGLIRSAQAVETPKPGYVEAGYEFLGGDPANPKSWKKVQ